MLCCSIQPVKQTEHTCDNKLTNNCTACSFLKRKRSGSATLVAGVACARMYYVSESMTQPFIICLQYTYNNTYHYIIWYCMMYYNICIYSIYETYTHTYIHIHVYVYVYKYIYTCIYIYIHSIHATCVYIYIYIYVYTYVYECVNVYICVCACIYIYI